MELVQDRVQRWALIVEAHCHESNSNCRAKYFGIFFDNCAALNVPEREGRLAAVDSVPETLDSSTGDSGVSLYAVSWTTQISEPFTTFPITSHCHKRLKLCYKEQYCIFS